MFDTLASSQPHRSALDCLLFTQPLTEPYKAPLFYPNMPANTESVKICLLANSCHRIIIYSCKTRVQL